MPVTIETPACDLSQAMPNEPAHCTEDRERWPRIMKLCEQMTMLYTDTTKNNPQRKVSPKRIEITVDGESFMTCRFAKTD